LVGFKPLQLSYFHATLPAFFTCYQYHPMSFPSPFNKTMTLAQTKFGTSGSKIWQLTIYAISAVTWRQPTCYHKKILLSTLLQGVVMQMWLNYLYKKVTYRVRRKGVD
jgi:hypothetical protein